MAGTRPGVLLGVVLIILGVALTWRRTVDVGGERGVASPPGSEVPGAPRTSGEAPRIPFTDITSAAGIHFIHFNGAEGEKLLPETMGGGVAFFDADGDGDQDLLFVGGTDWAWSKQPRGPASSLSLYLNDGKGNFRDATAGSGLEVRLFGMGVACGDYDGDGLPDLYVTCVGKSRLFHNLGSGKFADVTDAAGVGGESAWSTGAAWIDYDNDGDLDLFVCNYVQWSREIDMVVDYKLPGLGRAYGPPSKYQGSFPWLFRNEGGGKFKEVSEEAGIRIRNPASGQPMAKALAVAPVDIDRDGWIDLVVANDTVQNFLFLNQRDGRFAEVGAKYGIAFDADGQTRGAMGIDAARFRNDDALGIAIGNFANEMNALYVSQRETTLFADEAVSEGLGPASRQLLKFGLFFFDCDLDGRLDVLTANGHLEEGIERIRSDQRYRQPAQLFWNRGGMRGGRFEIVPPEKAGSDLFKPIVGRGSAFADIDGDGDLDVVLTQIGGAPLLLRNDQSSGHAWIRFKLVGRGKNRDAIGAWVFVKAGDHVYARQVMPTRSYLSQSELDVTVGLGAATKIDEVEIRWPGKQVQRVTGAKVGQIQVIRQE